MPVLYPVCKKSGEEHVHTQPLILSAQFGHTILRQSKIISAQGLKELEVQQFTHLAQWIGNQV